MTDDVRRTLDEHLMAALSVALSSGHTLTDAQRLISAVPASGRYVVIVGGTTPVSQDVFDDVRAAVAFYLDLCDPA